MCHIPTEREVEVAEKLSCWFKAACQRLQQKKVIPCNVSDKSGVAASATVFRYIDIVHSWFINTVTQR